MSLLADRADVGADGLTFGIPSRTVVWPAVVGADLLHPRSAVWDLRLLLADGRTRLVGRRTTSRTPADLVALRDAINLHAQGALPTVPGSPPGAWSPPIVLRTSLVSRGLGWACAAALLLVAVAAIADSAWGAAAFFVLFAGFPAWLTVALGSPTVADAEGLHRRDLRRRPRTLAWAHVTGFVPPRGTNQPLVVIGRAAIRPIPHATSSPRPSRRRRAWAEVHPRLVWLRDDASRRAAGLGGGDR